MSKSMRRRLEKLEEELKWERNRRGPWRVIWIDGETGERTDACTGEILPD
jgi:hypothetical protein